MDFGQALYCLKDGKKVQREEWEPDRFVRYQKEPPMLILYLGDKVLEESWQPPTIDMLAEDWQVVE